MKNVICICLMLHAIMVVGQNSASQKNTDYGNIANWAAHPWKNDLSDSVPKPLRTSHAADSTVDIFFLHPTSYLNKEMPYGWNAPVSAAEVNDVTDKGSMLYQASVFNGGGRVFAPRYRQAHISAYYPSSTDTILAQKAFEVAYADVKAAFEYYMQHYNQGRPFIIASHSQGTTHAIHIIQELVDTTALLKRMVAAYLVGIVVPENAFSKISACINPAQTGCVCSWRTFKKGYEPAYVSQENFRAIVTNPLTWNDTDTIASYKDNKGAILWKFDKVMPRTAEAIIHGNVLWTGKPRFFGNLLYTTKNYHAGDYNLYYLSIRENLNQRINAFWK